MFITLAPRLATSFAITIGTVAGGVLALMQTLPPADLTPEHTEPAVAQVSTSTQSALPQPKVTKPKAIAPTPEEPRAAEGATEDLIPSPHDHKLESEAELRKSERLCIRDLPDECVRVADAFQEGKVVAKNGQRASQYRNLAFKGYIRVCESNQPEGCYALARMYLYGDSVKANPAYAKNLMRRVVEVCRYKDAPICKRLVQEAPMPPKPKHR